MERRALVDRDAGGELLYLEELNRIPEETLNVLITAMAEREVVVPRVGRIAAADGFVLIAAMNPFDAIGTARVSQAIADRMCRMAIGYLDDRRSARWWSGRPAWGALGAVAVSVARGSRSHPAVRIGARSAARSTWCGCRRARNVRSESETGREILLDAAIAAMSGRVRVHEDQSAPPRR